MFSKIMIRCVALLPALVLGTAGCGGGGGGGGGGAASAVPVISTLLEVEPNDTPATATPLEFGVAGVGDTTTSMDTDYWVFFAEEGEVVSIELHGLTLDSVGWGVFCTSPRLRVYGPDDALVLETENGVFIGDTIDLDLPYFMIAETGEYKVQISTHSSTRPGGQYAVRVTPLDFEVQVEEEPMGASGENDSIASAQPIVPGLVWGDYVDSESDFYEITVDVPTQFWVEMFGYRAGRFPGESGCYDSLLRIWNESGAAIHSRDDSFFYDSAISFFVEPGTYFIEVLEWSGNSNSGEYFLRVRTFDRDDASLLDGGESIAAAPEVSYAEFVRAEGTGAAQFFTWDAEPGDMVRLEFFGFSSSGGNAINVMDPNGAAMPRDSSHGISRFMVLQGGLHTVRFTAGAGAPYAFRLIRWRQSLHQESVAGTLDGAEDLPTSLARSSVLTVPTDEHWYRVEATEGELLSISLYAARTGVVGASMVNGYGSSLRPSLELVAEDGTVLTRSAVAGGCGLGQRLTRVEASVEVSHVPESSGSLYLRVTMAQSTGASAHYLIEHSPR